MPLTKTTDPERTWFSDADRAAYDRMPSGWFFPDELDFVIRNPRWRCDRLVGLRALESDVVGDISDLRSIKTRYRKLPLSPNVASEPRRHEQGQSL